MVMLCSCGLGKSLGERRLPKTIPLTMLKAVESQTRLAPSEVTAIYSRFRQLAPFGMMSFAKFKGTMGMLGMLDDPFLSQSMFSAFDANHDGQLNFVEFATAIGTMIRGSDDEKLELAFRILCPGRSTSSLREHDKQNRTPSASGHLLSPAEQPRFLDASCTCRSPEGTIRQQRPTKPKQVGFSQLPDTTPHQYCGGPCLTYSQFRSVVMSLDWTRQQLVGGDGDPIDDDQILRVFEDVAQSRAQNGAPAMSLEDFKRSVRGNPEFLCLLGIFPGPQDRHISLSTCHSTLFAKKKKDEAASHTGGDLMSSQAASAHSSAETARSARVDDRDRGDTLGDTTTCFAKSTFGADAAEQTMSMLSQEESASLSHSTSSGLNQLCASAAAGRLNAPELAYLKSELATILNDIQRARKESERTSPAVPPGPSESPTRLYQSESDGNIASIRTFSAIRPGRLSGSQVSTACLSLHGLSVAAQLSTSLGKSPAPSGFTSIRSCRQRSSSTTSVSNTCTIRQPSDRLASASRERLETPKISTRLDSSVVHQRTDLSLSRWPCIATTPVFFAWVRCCFSSNNTHQKQESNLCTRRNRDTASAEWTGRETFRRFGYKRPTDLRWKKLNSIRRVRQNSSPVQHGELPIAQLNVSDRALRDSTFFKNHSSLALLQSAALHVSVNHSASIGTIESLYCNQPSSQHKDFADDEIFRRSHLRSKTLTRLHSPLNTKLKVEVAQDTKRVQQVEDKVKKLLAWLDKTAAQADAPVKACAPTNSPPSATSPLPTSSHQILPPSSDHPELLKKPSQIASSRRTSIDHQHVTLLSHRNSFGATSAGAPNQLSYHLLSPRLKHKASRVSLANVSLRSQGRQTPHVTHDYSSVSRRMYMNRPNFEQRRISRRQGSLASIQQRMHHRRRPEYKLLGPSKGIAVHFGHPSWNMMLNMMVGIRLAAGRINNEPRRKVEAYDFIMKEKISILPRSQGTFDTPSLSSTRRQMEAVRFIDYAPMVFRKLREFFGVTPHAYLQSVGPEHLVGNMVLGNLASLSELCSEGKSGAFFYYTADGRFLIKTITRDAAKFFQHILKDYYEHILKNPETLITRIYGFHAMRLKKESGNVGDKLYFVIMGNVFHTPVEIHRRYDLKGSWVGRSSGPAAQSDPTIAMKDVDLVALHDKISVGPSRREALIKIIETDAYFFRDHMILDYSLLVGIHFKAQRQDDEVPFETKQPDTTTTSSDVRHSVNLHDDILLYPARQRDIEGIPSSDNEKIYYLGIIDILTRWTTAKRLEHDFKVLSRGNGKGISCTHPALYAKRFVEFLKENIE